jgi:hypothetical protein
MTPVLKPEERRGIDAGLAHIDRMRKKLREDFDRAMAKLDADERELLGLRADQESERK